MHGDSGLGGATLPPPAASPAAGHAIDYIIDTIRAAPGEITLVATGPADQHRAGGAKRSRGWRTGCASFVIMGGSAGRGNVTPAAEYNMWADPEAAAAVFRAGWTVHMLGLDVTLRTRATPAVRQRMRGLGPLGTELLLPALEQYRSVSAARRAAGARRVRRGLGGAARPVRAGPGAGPGGDGRAADRGDDGDRLRGARRWAPGGGGNARVAMRIDVDGFWELTLGAYRRVAAAMLS